LLIDFTAKIDIELRISNKKLKMSATIPCGDSDEMEFIPYPKIPTSITQCTKGISQDTEAVVLEKVHGANLPVYGNGRKVRFAKRTGFLLPNQWFYNYETLVEELTYKVNSLYNLLKSTKMYPDMKYVIVYGELYGGYYPEDDKIDTWKGAFDAKRINEKHVCIIPQEERAVREGIYYSPDVKFIAFDICIVGDKSSSTQNKWLNFLNYNVLMEMCKKVNVDYLYPLMIGPLKKCLSFNYKFDSRIAVDVCKQKKLPSGSNVAEGVVIKLMDSSKTYPLSVKNGQTQQIRPIIKHKHPSFAEISGDFTMPDISVDMILSSMVNINRLNAVLSKYGKCDKIEDETTINEVEELLVEDVWADFYECHSAINPVTNYSKSNTLVQIKAQKLVRESLLSALKV